MLNFLLIYGIVISYINHERKLMVLANCPKCGQHLRLIDWKQHCPHCGTNIMLYDQQERLMREADIAEVQYYHFQKKIDRLKSAFIGTKLAILRIVTSILPIAALFLPLINVKIGTPFNPIDGNVNFITVYKNFDGLTGNAIPELMSGSDKNAAIIFIAAFALLLLSLVITLVHFIMLTLACSPKGKARNITLDVMIAVFTLGSAVAALITPDFSAVSGLKLGAGAYVYILLQAVNIAVDCIVLKKGIPVKHKQCYVGGIPIEEYFQMKDDGMTVEEIRRIQYERLLAIQKEKEEKYRIEQEKIEKEEKAKKEAEANV